MSKTCRYFKGESLIAFPEEYVVLDLETTGFSPVSDEIIEIAAIKVENGHVAGELQMLVNTDNPVPAHITSLTGISDEMVRKDGIPKVRAVRTALSFIGDCMVVGHNVSFDINFIYDNALRLLGVHFTNDFIDTCRIARRVINDTCNYKLGTLTEYFGITNDSAHRALSDVYATYKLFQKLESVCNVRVLEEANGYKRRSYKSRPHHVDTCYRDSDPSNDLYGKVCVLTGELEKLSRAQATSIIKNIGGSVRNSVSSRTDYLIVGHAGCSHPMAGTKSSKRKKAEEIIAAGGKIKIMAEEEFYRLAHVQEVV